MTKPLTRSIRIGKNKAVEIIKNAKGALSVISKTKNKDDRKFQFNGGSAKDAGLGFLTVKDRTIGEIRTINTQEIKQVKSGRKTYKVI